ncbi:uncharacterized protein LOC113349767 [Papaver somniferum]|uniref:uncharacterized protein LOC113349767 n=1 Tax=Papaver somniferum TaxID=3469 RepID=UPI000E6F5D86|nr:uncharacterized protein LOC113349767 [Papaver somniferum]
MNSATARIPLQDKQSGDNSGENEDEKDGGNQISQSVLDENKELLYNNGLHILNFIGNPFTWKNRRKGHALVLERVTKSQLNTKQELKKWNYITFGNINTQIHKIKCQIEEILRVNNTNNTPLLEELKCKLNQWYDIEADFWKQRNRNDDLKDGERNTAYYHNKFNFRRKKTNIDTLQNNRGEWLTERADIANNLKDHFFIMSMSSFPSNPDEYFNNVVPCITDEENSFLTVIPTHEEIKNVVFSMHSWDTPGPDGFLPGFYQKMWPTVGNDTVQIVQAYKSIISKLLVTRLKPLLNKFISPFQSAFIPDRMTQDNIVMDHELIYTMKKTKSVKGWMALKLDMSEMYKPQRGLRQGDPLSPYLFILYDCLLFARANTGEAKQIASIIDQFSKYSGQSVNFDKSGLAFSRKVPNNIKCEISNILRIQRMALQDKYLGVPLLLQKNKVESFAPLMDRFSDRQVSWVRKGICDGLEIIKQFYCWQIGDDILEALFDNETVKAIQEIRIPIYGRDTIRWKPTANGDFSVKTAYRDILDSTQPRPPNNNEIEWKAL